MEKNNLQEPKCSYVNVTRKMKNNSIILSPFWSSFAAVPPFSFTTMVRKLQQKDVKKRVKKSTKRMPFQPSPRTIQPRSMKDRQQMWCLAGLRHLRAPIVVWFEMVISFDMYMLIMRSRGSFPTSIWNFQYGSFNMAISVGYQTLQSLNRICESYGVSRFWRPW